MKLGKSLIITGLLFSSILGSVNVGSITAMAAEQNLTGGADNNKEKTVTVNYIDEAGNSITDSGFTGERSINVLSSATVVTENLLGIPETYKLITDLTKARIDDKNNITLTVKKIDDKSENIDVHIIFVNKQGDNIPAANIKPIVLKDKKIDSKITEKDAGEAPAGYKFVSGQSVEIVKDKIDGVAAYIAKIEVEDSKQTVVTTKKPSKHGGHASQRVRISFIDQYGDEVGFQQLNGNVSSTRKISAPKGYSLVNAKDADIKFDKSSNKNLKLNVTKNKPVSTMEEGIITTNSGEFKHLYTIEGKDITNRGLSGDSKWYTDQYATINGEKMFRVATNEWVKATDVYK
ncbi:hypothetical protein ACFQAV_10730 [Companilactobacillus huachuanensis]|uniref:Surface layer protein A domain-containing protein n=1 Tax=Companilactobacillus huachuanensis TaxID=2559914 RepID=A0ABW1RP79_9LACO|nr:hypothetical protein [Companilactobacillus huachuanensis]